VNIWQSLLRECPFVNTPLNRVVARRLWKERNQKGHLAGITTFNDSRSSSAEDLLVSELDKTDLHHGSHSANPRYTILEVLGAPLSDRVIAELSQYGVDESYPSAAGFRAVPAVSSSVLRLALRLEAKLL
jgi:hypothetical protein